jgi:hypothetical protein
LVTVRVIGVIHRDPVSGRYGVTVRDVDRMTVYLTGATVLGDAYANMRRLIKEQFPEVTVNVIQLREFL